MLKKRNALGRGLEALLSDSSAASEDLMALGTINEISVDIIEVNPFQPRTDFAEQSLKELAESIKIHGIIQPITVRKLDRNRFQLISGERRLQASKLAGLTAVPCYIRTANDQEMLEMALVENIHREDLNAIEIALSYNRLVVECSLKQEQLGDRVGKDRTTVNNYMRLLRLPPLIQAGLRDRQLSMGHARALVNIENIDQQIYLYNRIIKEQLSVRKVEELVRQLANTKNQKPIATKNPDADLVKVQSQLADRFGTKVQIKKTEKDNGEIKIPFSSVEELNRILDIFNL